MSSKSSGHSASKNPSAPAELQVGSPAPQWSATAQFGSDESTSDSTLESGTLSSDSLKGESYILYFYPKDMTPGCTTQACDFQENLTRLKGLGYRVIGVSPDPLKRHIKFQAKHDLTFDLISDEDHQVSELFGVWREKKNYGRTYMGIVRSTYVINADGVVEHALTNVRAKGHVLRVIELLSKEKG